MSKKLSQTEILQLIQRVFAPRESDRNLFILLDVPNDEVWDNKHWRERRAIAAEWKAALEPAMAGLGLERVDILYFENAGKHNADLPGEFYAWNGAPVEADLDRLQSEGEVQKAADVWARADLILALTEFSPSAPLKILARTHQFRAASMPGFSAEMIPALRVNFEEIHERCMQIKRRLDEALAINIWFEANEVAYQFHVDLRHRTSHASSGLLREPGTVGNLPSGETYIVPYEGELHEESETAGMLPVQFGEEVVVYEVQHNRAVEIISEGRASEKELEKLRAEPAYGNIAEIGFGVLEAFGIKPIGAILLDEKLGLHIAFGRSDHFGGAVAPGDFRSPKNVEHIDRIYIRAVQPKIEVKEVVLIDPHDRSEVIMRDGEYDV